MATMTNINAAQNICSVGSRRFVPLEYSECLLEGFQNIMLFFGHLCKQDAHVGVLPISPASSTPGSHGQTETLASTLVIPRPCEMIVDVHAVEAFKLHPLSRLPLTLSALFSLCKVSS